MSRKNLLTSITERKLTAVNTDEVSARSQAVERNRSRGAFGAITKSIDELAAKAQSAREFEARLLKGATVVELDPAILDASFVADRMGDDREAFDQLVEAIRERGQDSPILVRPHPTGDGRYMIVFGHRRARAANILGKPVKAVVKDLDDKSHVIAQGQENSARADLSFIEKAVFASNLETKGYDRSVIMAALSVDKSVVSKMISVANDIPSGVINAIGAAKESGRDRWYALAVKFRESLAGTSASEFVQSPAFLASDSDQRLALLTQHLDGGKPTPKFGKLTALPNTWAPKDGSISVTVRSTPKKTLVTYEAKNGPRFAAFIAGRLDELYEAFLKSDKVSTGD